MSSQNHNMPVFAIVFLSGLAALSWGVIWQLKASLALGVSAWGTAITVSVTMGGLAFGSILMGMILRKLESKVISPFLMFSILEILIGLCGIYLEPAFAILEHIDSLYYEINPELAPYLYMFGLSSIIGVPALCMGATFPVFALITKRPSFINNKHSIAHLYGTNTLGAAIGTLLVAFLFIPILGIFKTIILVAGINFLTSILILFVLYKDSKFYQTVDEEMISPQAIEGGNKNLSPLLEVIVVIISGMATFILEIAWFRSLTAAFMSTTDAFAIMLSAVLLGLGFGAYLVPNLRRHPKVSIGGLAFTAACLIFLTTPIVERFDLFSYMIAPHSLFVFLQWFLISLFIIGGNMVFVGMLLPWVLDRQTSSRKCGFLYSLNAVAAIIGSLSAAWILLPEIGLAKTAWVSAFLIGLVGFLTISAQMRFKASLILSACFIVAFVTESGIGELRIQGTARTEDALSYARVIKSQNGPDSTVSVVEMDDGGRSLFIDGFETTAQLGEEDKSTYHYMSWMGHLPMIAHPDPKTALVICFGTGQTANALREENIERLDVVDINKNVINMADFFPANKGVLKDPRVHVTIMDGRSYIRRTQRIFDVITLEPMPPNFAGVNALYSREFYEYAKNRLSEQGVIAQWVPFHLLNEKFTKSVMSTFMSVFPNSLLWVDPPSGTGILLGSKDANYPLGEVWTGYDRQAVGGRDLSKEDVSLSVVMDKYELAKYVNGAQIITDDNQLLSYGEGTYLLRSKVNERNNNHFAFVKMLEEKKKEKKLP